MTCDERFRLRYFVYAKTGVNEMRWRPGHWWKVGLPSWSTQGFRLSKWQVFDLGSKPDLHLRMRCNHVPKTPKIADSGDCRTSPICRGRTRIGRLLRQAAARRGSS